VRLVPRGQPVPPRPESAGGLCPPRPCQPSATSSRLCFSTALCALPSGSARNRGRHGPATLSGSAGAPAGVGHDAYRSAGRRSPTRTPRAPASTDLRSRDPRHGCYSQHPLWSCQTASGTDPLMVGSQSARMDRPRSSTRSRSTGRSRQEGRSPRSCARRTRSRLGPDSG
jgi:hypothetical protein